MNNNPPYERVDMDLLRKVAGEHAQEDDLIKRTSEFLLGDVRAMCNDAPPPVDPETGLHVFPDLCLAERIASLAMAYLHKKHPR